MIDRYAFFRWFSEVWFLDQPHQHHWELVRKASSLDVYWISNSVIGTQQSVFKFENLHFIWFIFPTRVKLSIQVSGQSHKAVHLGEIIRLQADCTLPGTAELGTSRTPSSHAGWRCNLAATSLVNGTWRPTCKWNIRLSHVHSLE